MTTALWILVTTFYVGGFTFLCREAVGKDITVWRLLAGLYSEIAVGLVGAFAVLGLAPKSVARPRPRRVDPARIRQLERELGIGQGE